MNGHGDPFPDYFNRFREFERQHDVFEVTCGGIPIWERIRIRCFRTVMQESGVMDKPHTKVDRNSIVNYIKGGYKFLRGLIRRNPFLAPEADFLFIGGGRRKPRADGYQWDIFCDPILQSLDLDNVYVEPHYKFSHRRPAKTDPLWYLDAVTYTSVVQRTLGLASYELTATEADRLAALERELAREFDIDIDLQGMVRDALSERASRKWLYERLLNRIDPEIVVIVVSAFKSTLIEVCKEHHVPVVEMQHGGGHHNHLWYTFPDGVDVTTYPDYLFVFGKFWKETVNYPLPDEQVYAVGYPYLEAERAQYAGLERNQQIIFSSQGSIGEQLSRTAVDFADLDTGYDIVYKLHPKEYGRWRAEYPWLVDADLTVVDSDTPPLYELLAQSEVNVGVYSTVIYEGFAFGLDTYLLDAPNVSRMRHLVDRGHVSIVSSAEEIASELNSKLGEDPVKTDYFFEPNAVDNILSAFDEIRRREE